jgi:hypothetical protein
MKAHFIALVVVHHEIGFHHILQPFVLISG